MTDLRVGSMVVEDTGGGAPIVMIHGLGGTSNSFQTLITALGGYRVLRPDLPGAGRSSLRPGVPGIGGMASAVKDCLQAAGIDRAHFVGHSMGTLICQHIAAGNPEAVASLTLFGPIAEPPVAARAALKERANAARTSGMTDIAEAISRATISEKTQTGDPVVATFVRESLMRQDPVGYATHCEALSEAVAADHGAIRCSTLLVAGASDPVAPVDMARQLRDRIAGARLEIVPDTGHWIMVEAPRRSADLLREHLDGVTW